MKELTVVLIAIAFIILLYGYTVAQSAPQEAVFAALACFFGILSRLAQAASYHSEIKKLLKPKSKPANVL